MNYVVESLRQLIGMQPRRPAKEEFTPRVVEVHLSKKGRNLDAEAEAHKREHGETGHKWRTRRWITLVLVNLLFVISYYFDVQLVEGAMTASRVIGFHFADLNSALQVMLAYKHVVLNLLIGTLTVFTMWWLLGGRSFCSWACPYHLLAEWAEALHLQLAKRKLVKDHTFHRGVRGVFYLIFVALTAATGYTVYETISPTGIVSRALIYGPGLAMLWVLALLLFEVFVSRRAWCRYICPIGITYGVVGAISPLRVRFHVEECHHEGDCRKVCLVPHVLDSTIKGRAADLITDLPSDCTRCGLCVDICPTNSLRYHFKGPEVLR